MQLECSQLQGIGSESWQPCKFCHAGERDDCPLFNALQFAAAAPPHTQSVPLPTHTQSLTTHLTCSSWQALVVFCLSWVLCEAGGV